LQHKPLIDAAIFYPPQLFNGLNIFQIWLNQLGDDFFPTRPHPKIDDVNWQMRFTLFLDKELNKVLGTKKISAPLGLVDALIKATKSIDFDKGLSHCLKQSKDKTTFNHHMMCWFDSFKTLKWLHNLRAILDLKNIPLDQYLKQDDND